MNKNAKKKVLLMSAPVGAGHVRAAEAIAEEMLDKHENIEPVMCNVFDFFSSFLGKAILKIYFKILDFFPEIYGRMYAFGNENSFIAAGNEYISRYLAARMSKFILNHNPVLIVCTHVTPAGIIALLKKQGRLEVPAAAVITDYVVHKLWVYPEFEHYFVATEEMAGYLKDTGIEQNKIEITGIPVLTSFGKTFDREAVCGKLGLSSAIPTLLLMGGGAGLLPMNKILEYLQETGFFLRIQLQILIITGKNKAMYEKVTALAGKIPNQTIKIYRYVENVYELMAISDVLISKPGGMSSAEALASGIPLLIYRPLPGQEEANARYLTEQGAAVLAESYSLLADELKQIFLENPHKLGALKNKAKIIAQPDAAIRIVNCLEKYI